MLNEIEVLVLTLDTYHDYKNGMILFRRKKNSERGIIVKRSCMKFKEICQSSEELVVLNLICFCRSMP